MNLHLLPEARRCVEQSYFVTGSMRTGTTIFAAIVRSIIDVEVFHEPASAYVLFPLLNNMADDAWTILYETCVFEDNLIPSIDGIKLNLNYFDESSIRKSITGENIEEKLTKVPDHEKATLLADRYQLAVKIPEMMPYLDKFKSLYPKITLIILIRQPASVVSSLIQKGYYSDDRVFRRSKKWPIRITSGGYFLPFWLPEELEDYWLSSSEVERCCFSYVYQYEQYIPTSRDTIVDYDKLCEMPERYFGEISKMYQWRFGTKTGDLLKAVKEPEKDRTIPLHGVSEEIKERMYSVYREYQELAI